MRGVVSRGVQTGVSYNICFVVVVVVAVVVVAVVVIVIAVVVVIVIVVVLTLTLSLASSPGALRPHTSFVVHCPLLCFYAVV